MENGCVAVAKQSVSTKEYSLCGYKLWSFGSKMPQGKLKKKYLSKICGLPKSHKIEIVYFTGSTTDALFGGASSQRQQWIKKHLGIRPTNLTLFNLSRIKTN